MAHPPKSRREQSQGGQPGPDMGGFNGGAQGGAQSGPADDGVVDADYKVVDDDDKK